MDELQPIVIKKIIKGGHVHHGGAWKVAFADFVTAMMAFFLLLWLMGSTTPEEKSAISNYFENPNAIQGSGGASTSVIKISTVDQQQKMSESDLDSKTKNQQSKPVKPEPEKISEQAKQKDAKRLEALKQSLEKAIEASQALASFKDQLLLDITPEGLRIQIIDKENRPMFASGSARLKSYTKVILHEIAKLISTVPNKISLTGHTDATPFKNMRGYTNWELSADRANASRRALVFGGFNQSKVAKVVGFSSTILFNKQLPLSPVNRRISLVVLNKETEQALERDNLAKSLSAGNAVMEIKADASEKRGFVDPGDVTATSPIHSQPITVGSTPSPRVNLLPTDNSLRPKLLLAAPDSKESQHQSVPQLLPKTPSLIPAPVE
jgi:chemotaxis protein MotB